MDFRWLGWAGCVPFSHVTFGMDEHTDFFPPKNKGKICQRTELFLAFVETHRSIVSLSGTINSVAYLPEHTTWLKRESFALYLQNHSS
jgi:hypothetical protein